jgi:uncharacterized delta-60 repeat protein
MEDMEANKRKEIGWILLWVLGTVFLFGSAGCKKKSAQTGQAGFPSSTTGQTTFINPDDAATKTFGSLSVASDNIITARASQSEMITGRMITGRMITGRVITARIITGRIITARSPKFVNVSESDNNNNEDDILNLFGRLKKGRLSKKQSEGSEISCEDLKPKCVEGKVEKADCNIDQSTNRLSFDIKLSECKEIVDEQEGDYIVSTGYVKGYLEISTKVSQNISDAKFIVAIEDGDSLVKEFSGNKETKRVRAKSSKFKTEITGRFIEGEKDVDFRVVTKISGSYSREDEIGNRKEAYSYSDYVVELTGKAPKSGGEATLYMSIAGGYSVDTEPASCVEGTFNFKTIKPIKSSGGQGYCGAESGEIEVNNAKMEFSSGKVKVSVENQQKEYRCEELGGLCKYEPITIAEGVEQKPCPVWFKDKDGDGYTDGTTQVSCEQPDGYVSQAQTGDCNDNDKNINPNTVWFKDADKDGYTDGTTKVSCSKPSDEYVASATAGDCNDGDTNINPARAEICDGLDNNCNGTIDDGVLLVFYKDLDGDGYTDGATQVGCSAPQGYVLSATSGDCNDSDSSMNPGRTEICDNKDNNCNGQIDEGVLLVFYRDQDGDGYGYANNSTQACSQPAGYVSNSSDCDDNNANLHPNTIWFKDADFDGFYPAGGSQVSCGNPFAPNNATYVAIPGGDCNDTNPFIHPGAPLNCNNGQDNDCSGNIEKWAYTDVDGDRYAPNSTSSCVDVVNFPGRITVGYELGTNDCNDNNASIYPGAPLNCNNGQDNDCSGNVEKWAYTDQDGDRYAPNSTSSCVDVVNFPGKITVGYELGTNDCNDNNASINPSAADNTCDGIDNNCNLYVDENTAPCFAPTSFGIYSWGLTYVSLRWTYPEPSSNVEKFVIQRSPNGITYVDVAEAPASATNYTIKAYLTSKYYFRVYAKNATGSGSPSSVTSAPIGVNSLFEKTIGGSGDDFAHSITQSSDGGYVVAGYTSSFGAGSYDFYVVKLDSSGNVVWTKTIGGSGDDQAWSIIRSSDGNYVVAGWTNSFGSNYDFYVVKLDSSGNIIWTKTIGGSGDDQAWSIIQSSDGGYVVAGRTSSFGAGGWDFYVVKLDSSGNVQWTKTIGGPGSQDEAWSIIQSSDGGYVVAGWSDSFGAGLRDFYVVKLDANGNVVWSKTIGGIYGDGAHSIIQSSDGGYIVAGSTQTFGAGGWDIYLVKLDSSGNVQWTKTIGGPAFLDDALSIIQSSDGGYVVAGGIQSFGAGGPDMYVVKLDSVGNVQWTKTIGGSGWDGAFSIIQSSDGGYVVAGYTRSFGAVGEDFYVVKLAPDGTLGCHDSFQNPSISSGGVEASPTPLSSYVSPLSSFVSPVSYSLATTDIALCMLTFAERIGGSNDDFAYSIIQSSDGGYVVAGYTNSFGGSYDFYVVKLDSSGSVAWTKTIGGSGDDQANSVVQSSDGSYVVAGYTTSFGAGGADMYVVKLGSGGNVQWTKTIGGSDDDFANSVIQSSDGGYVIAGYTQSFGAGGYDMYVVKLDSNGNVVWTKTIGGSNSDVANSIVQSSDGGYVVAGETLSFGASGRDIYVVKLDSSGNIVWTKTIGGSWDDFANSVIQSSDGGYVIAGYTQSFGAGWDDIYVVKLDSSGNVQWTKTIGGSADDEAWSIIQSSDGGYVVAGRTNSFGAVYKDIYVVKLDSSGNVQWTKTIGGSDWDEAWSIIQSSDGGYVVAGYTYSFGAVYKDIYVVKMGSLGDTCWSQGITNYVVSSVSSSFSSPSTVAFPQSPTVTFVSPASGSGGSVSPVCFSAGAPPVPMCLISGGCDYYQAGSDMQKIAGTMKGVERERERSEVKSYGCSAGGVLARFLIPASVLIIIYGWFRFRKKRKV